MEERLLGTTLPVLSISLDPGESVMAEAGEFSWITDSIQMSTGMGGGGGQGPTGVLERTAGGSSLLFSTHTARGAPGTIAFASKAPGSIIPVDVASGRQYDVASGRQYMVHRRGFLAGVQGIQVTAGFQQSFSAGVFAGEGLRSPVPRGRRARVGRTRGRGDQARTGPGPVAADASGTRRHVRGVGHLPGRAGQGYLQPALLRRHAHFAVLSGPGTVRLQSMPLPLLAASLAAYLADGKDRGAVEGGIAGGIIDDLLL